MLKSILHFVKYNNAFTIIFVICFFSFSISYAASPVVRGSVYSSQESLVSADNRSIISADLDNFNFNLVIRSVTEDDKNYYAVYTYHTFTLEDGVWQLVEMENTLTVNKASLEGKDFGLYATKELASNINYELSYLKRVQKLEREKGESKKVVNVTYSGLIGKMLDPKEKVIEGYDPIIPEIVKKSAATDADTQQAAAGVPYILLEDEDNTPASGNVTTPTQPAPTSPVSTSTSGSSPTGETSSTAGGTASTTSTEQATSTPSSGTGGSTTPPTQATSTPEDTSGNTTPPPAQSTSTTEVTPPPPQPPADPVEPPPPADPPAEPPPPAEPAETPAEQPPQEPPADADPAP